ncbi:helix-turn-helix transcriptional regulator [Pararoseomonas sp. SCSIO 73927]|uniref:helix-turn-helix domain-containing protein n=1 Tax=Pararoseomonas sp. SCSIO 73927 TaxID=3114537 RepID=UPI0030D2D4F7
MVDDPRDTLPPIEEGSGNVFADLGLPGAAEADEKVRLATMVNREIRRLGLRQAEAGARLGSNQAEMSRLANYKLSGFSERRLIGFLNALGLDVEITVRRVQGRPATTTVRELTEA